MIVHRRRAERLALSRGSRRSTSDRRLPGMHRSELQCRRSLISDEIEKARRCTAEDAYPPARSSLGLHPPRVRLIFTARRICIARYCIETAESIVKQRSAETRNNENTANISQVWARQKIRGWGYG